MSRAPLVLIALAGLAAGAGALLVAATGAGRATRAVPASAPHLAAAYPRAAAAAFGRRVLVLRAHPLEPIAGEILESARAGAGWELHPGAPGDAPVFATRLAELSLDAARDWDAGGALSADTVDALARAAVAIVVIDDGRSLVATDRALDVAGVVAEPAVPALRIRGAEPVLRVTGEEVAAAGARPRLEPARVRDLRDGLWGGSVVVEASEPGTYVFAWPREGADVRVRGAPATPREPVTSLPFVTLDLPAGESDVEVTYGASAGSAPWAIGGALAVVISIVTLLLLLRPHPERDAPSPSGGAA